MTMLDTRKRETNFSRNLSLVHISKEGWASVTLLSLNPTLRVNPAHIITLGASVFPSVKWRQHWSETPFCLPGMIWERVRSCLGRLGELQRRPKINSRRPNCLEEQRLPQPQFHSPIIVGEGESTHSSAARGLIALS